MLPAELRIEIEALQRELRLLEIKKKGFLAQIKAIQDLCSHAKSKESIYDRECSECGAHIFRIGNS